MDQNPNPELNNEIENPFLQQFLQLVQVQQQNQHLTTKKQPDSPYQIENGVLQIINDLDLQTQHQIQILDIHTLELINCQNDIQITNDKVVQLDLRNSHLSLSGLKLENVHKLKFYSYMQFQEENKNLTAEIARQFKKLKSLHLDARKIDLNHLREMTSLQQLELPNCSLLQINVIGTLINLTELNINGNKGVDISPLQHLTKLIKLQMIRCSLDNLNVLKPLTALTELNICNNRGVSGLQLLTSLKILKIDSCNLKNLDQLRPLTKLFELFINQNEGVDITAIQHLQQLVKLQAGNCGLVNLDPLQHFANLEELNLFYNKGVNISSLKHLIQLKVLEVDYCDINSLEMLRPLCNLVKLSLNFNERVDITPLQHMTYLLKLEINSCCLVNIDVLKHLINLQELSLSSNAIIFIQPLEELKYLTKLNARFNKIIDLNTLEKHQNFKIFEFENQEDPTKDELKSANITRNINCQMSLLTQKLCNIKAQNTAVTNRIFELLDTQQSSNIQFIAHVTFLFKQLDLLENVTCQ
ncbi:Conserved_hypothetical protein [Hexamita inflata]|uniref:Uncharacterized protein n=1 Tax=Hexamita inflata TaxID=28002 RepID=A0ABP1HH17_9EUKA